MLKQKGLSDSDFERFERYVNDMNCVLKLLLNLSRQLARCENSLKHVYSINQDEKVIIIMITCSYIALSQMWGNFSKHFDHSLNFFLLEWVALTDLLMLTRDKSAPYYVYISTL